MLNKAERYEVLKVIQRCCTLGVLPAQVDLSSWELHPRVRADIWKCHLWFFLTILNATYKVGSLAGAYFSGKDTPLHEMIVHAMIAFSAHVYIYWYYVLYFKYPSVFRVYASLTLTGNVGGTYVDGKAKMAWGQSLKENTPQDVFTMSLPYMVSSAVAAIIVALMCNPSMMVLLYAAVPKDYQTWATFGLLICEESRFLIALISIGIPVWTLQLISFDRVNHQLQLLINSMQRRGLENVYKSLRSIQLYVGIVNLVNCFVIFSWKVLCITASIGAGYAAIAHFGDYPLFGVMYYVILLDCSFIYTFSYGKAFKIPALFEKSTEHGILHMSSRKSPAAKLFKLQVASIPRVGIKVGDYHMMERESTLIFIHYVLNYIMAMLVANRRS